MGIFEKFKRKRNINTSKTVWRNINNQIVCPGDACPKECDDTCPIYLNTKCIMLMQMGADDAALMLYKKVLDIAPDFYDAYNNIAGIYGNQGKYQAAYDYYLKAHELNKTKPSSVYGLALCCRDLNKPDECIRWCEEYNRLSVDNALAEVYSSMKAKLGITEKNVESSESETVHTLIRDGVEWSIIKTEDFYLFVNKDQRYATTPQGLLLKTSYLELAERILDDLDTYGPGNFSSNSILPWHYTMIEKFAQMEHKEIEDILTDSFINRYDWTYAVDSKGTEWEAIWGVRGIRENEIAKWLSKLTHMQLTAVCCIGNAYHTINVAYMLTTIMETCNNDDRKEKFSSLANFIRENSEFDASIDTFETFELYYGIHLIEKGNVIT